MQIDFDDIVTDPACGTGGFPVEALSDMQRRHPKHETHLSGWAQTNLFGIDNCCTDQNYITQCSQSEQQTYQKRTAGKCHQVGDYCSRKTIFGLCLEKTKTHCCFSSLLARVVQEQGRGQLGMGFGDPKAPSCDGFSPTQLTALNWGAFDLSEFYAQINPTPLPQGTAVGDAQTAQPACYWGQGRC